MLEFITYFFIGGLVVSLTTVYGAKGHSLLAAFISQFPSMTVLIFILLYTKGGKQPVIDYARSFVYVIPPWILYVCAVVFLCERIGIWGSLATGLALYMATSGLFAMLR